MCKRQNLKEGKSVLLIPENSIGRKTKFSSHFWNPIMFVWNPLIVGTLIADKHPAFDDFPTANYADWQWWDILNYGTALEINNLKNITPIIQSIDSYETNRKLGLAFEANVDAGKLFVLSVDPGKDIDKRPAMSQLLNSVKKYVASGNFKPVDSLYSYELDAIFHNPAVEDQKTPADAATRQLLNQ